MSFFSLRAESIIIGIAFYWRRSRINLILLLSGRSRSRIIKFGLRVVVFSKSRCSVSVLKTRISSFFSVVRRKRRIVCLFLIIRTFVIYFYEIF